MIKLSKDFRCLNSNVLKLIAAAAMFVDHLGLIFFPYTLWLRAIGRLAMPIFAFFIAEGCRYTKNKLRYFLMLFGLGAACQLVYFIFDPYTVYFGILISFSISVLMIYAMQFAKKQLFSENTKTWQKAVCWLPFIGLVICAYVFCNSYAVDYGFYGCMVPVFAAILDFHRIPAPDKIKKVDVLQLRVLSILIPLFFFVITNPFPEITLHAFLPVPLLLLYNGQRGKRKMKYFFYIFYPAHIGLLEGVYIVLYILKMVP